MREHIQEADGPYDWNAGGMTGVEIPREPVEGAGFEVYCPSNHRVFAMSPEMVSALREALGYALCDDTFQYKLLEAFLEATEDG